MSDLPRSNYFVAFCTKGLKFIRSNIFIVAKSRQQKKEIVQKLVDSFKSSASSVFVHFTGLSVGEETQMRGGLRSEGISYFVAKKKLMKLAWEDAGSKGEAPELEGEIAVAYSEEDPTSAARGIYTFVKKFKDKLTIMGGIYEGSFKSALGMNEIATIPPVDTLRGMFANVVNSPLQRLVIALDQIAETKTDK